MSNEVFVPDYEYCDLLKENTLYHAKVRAGKAFYASTDWETLQNRLLQIELRLSSASIVAHAAYCFPRVGQE